jgi:hypothetical protein
LMNILGVADFIGKMFHAVCCTFVLVCTVG